MAAARQHGEAPPLLIRPRATPTMNAPPGAHLVSTWVLNPGVHVEGVAFLVNPAARLIVANDEVYAQAA